MFSQPYQLEGIGFACCFRVYYRWRTHRACPCTALAALDRETLGSLLHPYGIRILEASAGRNRRRGAGKSAADRNRGCLRGEDERPRE